METAREDGFVTLRRVRARRQIVTSSRRFPCDVMREGGSLPSSVALIHKKFT